MSINWTELSSDSFSNPELSKQSRMIARKQSKLYEIVEPAAEFTIGKNSGDKVAIKIFGRISGTAESALGEFTKVPFGDLPEYSVSFTATQKGLALALTGARADLDRVDINSAMVKALQDHGARTMNKIVKDALDTGRSFCYVALTSSTYNFTTNGTPSGSANSAFSLFHLRKMKLEATKQNMPFADGGNYWLFASPRMVDDLHQDTGAQGYSDVAKYDPSKVQGLLAGEVGKIGNVRVVMDNDQLTDTIGTGSVYGQGYMCGADSLREILVYPMHFRAQKNLGQDFNRQSALCYLLFNGVKAPWNFTAHGQATYVAYTSA